MNKNSTERVAAFRKRQAETGAMEVRGIFAHLDDHAAIKKYAARIVRKREADKPSLDTLKDHGLVKWPQHPKEWTNGEH